MAKKKSSINRTAGRSPVFDVRGEGGGARLILPVGKGNTYPGAKVQPHAHEWPLGWREEVRLILSRVRLTSFVADCFNLGGVGAAGIHYRSVKWGSPLPEPLLLAIAETVAHSAREVRDELLARRAEAIRIANEVAAAAETVKALSSVDREGHAAGMELVAAALLRESAAMRKAKKKAEAEELLRIEVLVAAGHADEAAAEMEEEGRRKGGGKDPLKLAATAAMRVAKAEPERMAAALEKLVGRINEALEHVSDAVVEAGRRLVLFGDLLKLWASHIPSPAEDVSVGVIDDHTPKTRVEAVGTLRAQQGGHGVLVSHPVAEGYAERGYGRWEASHVGQTLKASGGYIGGGSESILVLPAEGGKAEWAPNPDADATAEQEDSVQDVAEPGLPARGEASAMEADMAVEVDAAAQAKETAAHRAGESSSGGVLTDEDEFEAVIRELEGLVDKVEVLVAVTPKVWRVRRLTPIETARLQGMPDNWTAVPSRLTRTGKPVGQRKPMPDEEALQRQRMWAELGFHYTLDQIKMMVSDSVAYRLHGNSMTVPPVRALYRRLAMAMAAWTPERFPKAA